MLKRLMVACLCLTGAARADTDTPPVLTGIHECRLPRLGEVQSVKLAFLVTETGTVEDVNVVQTSGNPQGDRIAAECIAGWTYKPATHNGVPVSRAVVYTYHWGAIVDMTGDEKAFAELERDVDRRCPELYPVNRAFLATRYAVTMVTLARLPSGELQTAIVGSAGETADKQAVACVKDLVTESGHADLPAVFSRTLTIKWSRGRRR